MSPEIELAPKLAGETRRYSVSFLSRLAADETLSTVTTTAALHSGTDVSPSALISGSASISGSTASQSLTAGVAGAIYAITFMATTSLGQTLRLVGLLAVLPNTP